MYIGMLTMCRLKRVVAGIPYVPLTIFAPYNSLVALHLYEILLILGSDSFAVCKISNNVHTKFLIWVIFKKRVLNERIYDSLGGI